MSSRPGAMPPFVRGQRAGRAQPGPTSVIAVRVAFPFFEAKCTIEGSRGASPGEGFFYDRDDNAIVKTFLSLNKL